MADIERNLFILLSNMRELLRATKILSRILLITIKVYLGLPKEDNFSMDETQIDDIPQVLLRKITS
jgi:hypothetical protein